ncbi:MAG: SCO family protein [Pseudohongiellaceae bacterium]
MSKGITNTIIVCVAFIAVVLGLTFNRITSPVVMTRDQLNENGLFVYETPRSFNDFTLVDQDENPFTLEQLQGQWSLIFFGYTFCPDICPITMATLRQFMELLEQESPAYAEDTQVVMVSVDPQRDTPEKLAQYVSYFDPDYKGVSGEYIQIFNLARQLNVAFNYVPSENNEYLVSHSGEIILINPNGHFHGFFKTPHDPDKMLTNFLSVRETY